MNAQADGSIMISSEDLDSLVVKYPLLDQSDEDREQSEKEVTAELEELVSLMIEFLQQKQYRDLILVYLDVWQHEFARYNIHYGAEEEVREIGRARAALLVEDWDTLKKNLNNHLFSWWD
ncbi:hypothetical protein [Lactobacillus sp. HT06-2]|uniref:hypothetical protein n=1 Tax=Lactobacillus sp. HT06-2 TaxID=2080222 RepID=UPI000CD9F2F0|nr:hypothetical protein [Lactobacillus sp. HT06-2]